MCQLADLFSGMAAYTRSKSELMRVMLEKANNTESLFPELEQDLPKPSTNDKERFFVIQYFYKKCRSKKLGISLKSEGFLRTYDPANPINFWHYIPQHENDKAPTKD